MTYTLHFDRQAPKEWRSWCHPSGAEQCQAYSAVWKSNRPCRQTTR